MVRWGNVAFEYKRKGLKSEGVFVFYVFPCCIFVAQQLRFASADGKMNYKLREKVCRIGFVNGC